MPNSDDLLQLLQGAVTGTDASSAAPSTPAAAASPPAAQKSKSDALLDILKDPNATVPGEKTSPSLGVGGTINDEVNFAGTQFTKGILGVAALPQTLGKQTEEFNAKYGDLPQTGSTASPDTESGVPELGGRGAALSHLFSAHWPSYQDLHDFVFKTLGVPERDPQGPVEKLVAPGLQTLPIAAAGGGLLGGVRGGITAGAAGFGTSTAGEVAAEAFPEHADAARFLTELFTPLGISGAWNLAKSTAGMGLNTTLGRSLTSAGRSMSPGTASVLQDAADINVSVPRYMATDSEALPRTAASLQKVPLAGEKITEAAKTTSEQLGRAAENVKAGYGTASPVSAGSQASMSLGDWITGKAKDISARLYDNVADAISKARASGAAPMGGLMERRELINTRNMADQIEAERAGAGLDPGKAVGLVRPATGRRNPDTGVVEGGITGPDGSRGLDYFGVKTLRSHIGEMLDNPNLIPEGMSQTDLKRIYGALTKDMRNNVQAAGGPDATKAFDKANSVMNFISDRRDALTKIIGAKGDAPAEQVFDKLATMAGSKKGADIATLAQAKKAMGTEAWDNFASAHLGRMGFDASGKFSPDRFLTAWKNLSPAGKNLLFRSTGKTALADSLDKIANVSDKFSENITKFGNPSGTSHSVVGAAALFEAIKKPIHMLGTIASGNALASWLSKPVTAAEIAKWSAAYGRAVWTPTISNRNAYIAASSSLFNTLYGAQSQENNSAQ